MARVLYSQSTQQVTPYPRGDDEPVKGLDLDYLVLEKVGATPPVYDPATQFLQKSWTVDLPALEYRQSWEIQNLPPEPDWKSFNVAMIADPDWDPWIGQKQSLLAAAAAASMDRNTTGLQDVIDTAFAVLPAPDPASVSQWQNLADQYNIPIQF